MKKCSTEGCNGILCAKGLCRNCYQKIYYQTEKGKSGLKKYQKAYFQTEKGKSALKKYQNSEKGKRTLERYKNSEKGKRTLERYRNSERGKRTLERYRNSERGKEKLKESQKRYFNTEKGKEALTNYQHKRRTRKFDGEYQRFSPHDIFERDNWTCLICGEPIFEELKHPHHFSASIDHIIPLSKGGVHTPDNVQAAHLICNIRKGNRVT